MKVMISSQGCNLGDKIVTAFGKAPFYIVFDTATGVTECYKNTREEGTEHTHDIIEKLSKNGAEIVLAVHIGPHAFEIAESGGMKVYRAEKDLTISEAVKKFIKGELERLNEPTVKKHDHHH